MKALKRQHGETERHDRAVASRNAQVKERRPSKEGREAPHRQETADQEDDPPPRPSCHDRAQEGWKAKKRAGFWAKDPIDLIRRGVNGLTKLHPPGDVPD